MQIVLAKQKKIAYSANRADNYCPSKAVPASTPFSSFNCFFRKPNFNDFGVYLSL